MYNQSIFLSINSEVNKLDPLDYRILGPLNPLLMNHEQFSSQLLALSHEPICQQFA